MERTLATLRPPPPSVQADASPQADPHAPVDDRDPEAWAHAYVQALAVPFADRHREMWRWAWGIEPGRPRRPFVAIWPRGGGKSTNAEAVTVALGATGRRRYCLYISETQDQADEHVASIQALLESRALGAAYPGVSDPLLNKFGHSKGWRRNRVWTRSRFVVDAMGLDSAKRGAKAEDQRPDLIILDDVDGKHDTPAATARKIRTITDSILPGGSVDVAVLAVQNVLLPAGVFAQLGNLTDPPADWLADRIVSGPHPAIEGMELEAQLDAEGITRYRIVGGRATWQGQDLEACQHAINTRGPSAFKRESQHEDLDEAEGMFSHLNFRLVDHTEVPDLVRSTVWVDPAVTSTDDSDCMAIQADGIDAKGHVWRLYSWEARTSPQDALERAILKAVELGADTLGVETDQGGDTWQSVFREAARALQSSGQVKPGARLPTFKQAKAGAGYGPKVQRASQMLASYERGEITHVRGTHLTLHSALRRFPERKPFDLVDAAFWSWHELKVKRKPAVPVQTSFSTYTLT